MNSDSFRIIHIIGLVGAGKSTFIRQYLYEYPAFDIQTIYKECNFTPNDLFDNNQAYHQFQDALKYYFEGFIHESQQNDCPFVVVEFSGINLLLNGFLDQYSLYRIWIDAGNPLNYDDLFLEERPYAPELNQRILELWNNGEIPIDNTFNMERTIFSEELPSDLQELFRLLGKGKKSVPTVKINPELLPRISKVTFLGSQFQEFIQDGRFICPTCTASFSKAEFLQKHFERYPKCNPE